MAFGNLLAFVYHCFDRILIHGYLSGLSRPEQVVYFFRPLLGVPGLSKELLRPRTHDSQSGLEALARNPGIPLEWAEKGVRKEDHVLPWLHRMRRKKADGVYCIFKSMEQGPTFRIRVPKYPPQDPNPRILAPQRSRFTHFYFYMRDAVLGPLVRRGASCFPFQATSYLNGPSFIEQELSRRQVAFRKNDHAFLAVDDVAALQAAADQLSPEIIASTASTSGSAAPSPTVASITSPTPHTGPTVNSKPPTTRPTRPSKTSSTCSPQPDLLFKC